MKSIENEKKKTFFNLKTTQVCWSVPILGSLPLGFQQEKKQM
jgi:hypothetical protein